MKLAEAVGIDQRFESRTIARLCPSTLTNMPPKNAAKNSLAVLPQELHKAALYNLASSLTSWQLC